MADQNAETNAEIVPAESDRGFHLAVSKAGDGFWQKYGEPDKQHFVLRAQSDSAFAVRVIEDLLAEKFGGKPIEFTPAIDIQAPQESNITGVMDHTGDTPTKADIPGTTDVPPPATV